MTCDRDVFANHTTRVAGRAILMQGGGFMAEGGFFASAEEYEPMQPQPRGVPQQRGVPPRPRIEDGYEPDDYDEEGEAALAELEATERSQPEGSTSSPSAAPRALALGRCVDCSEVDGQQKVWDAFGISVCFACQRAAQGAGGKYQVVTKSKAKDEYLLTDRQLDRAQGGLGCITRPNPHDSRYGDMRLYLRSQVERLALKTWGSDEALLVEKERRSSERLAKAEAKKRKATAPTGGVTAVRKKAVSGTAALARAVSSVHKHVFLPDETYDEETDEWTKRCACGFEVKYERI